MIAQVMVIVRLNNTTRGEMVHIRLPAVVAAQVGGSLKRQNNLSSDETDPRFCFFVWETFIQRYIAERTNEAEIRPEEQSEKAESCRENLWDEIQLKGP